MDTDSKYRKITDFNLYIIKQEFRLPFVQGLPFMLPPRMVTAVQRTTAPAGYSVTHPVLRTIKNAVNGIAIPHSTTNVRSDVFKAVKINLFGNMPPFRLVDTYTNFG
jgi:hypothetical protein